MGGVCIKVKVLGGIKSKIKAKLSVDDWGFLTIHKETIPIIFFLELVYRSLMMSRGHVAAMLNGRMKKK